MRTGNTNLSWFYQNEAWEHVIPVWRFLTLHFGKINQISFSCLEQRYMHQIVSKLVPLYSLHHKKHKTYVQYGVKTNIFWSGVAKSAPVADRKILFWRATKCFDMNNCLSKKDFSGSYWGTFDHSTWKYSRFHNILYICFVFLMMSGIQWYQFRDNLKHILNVVQDRKHEF